MSVQKKPNSSSSQAERKAYRDLDAREAMAEHDRTQAAFDDNRERLRAERLARETADPAGGKLVKPTPQLPDDTRPTSFGSRPECAMPCVRRVSRQSEKSARGPIGNCWSSETLETAPSRSCALRSAWRRFGSPSKRKVPTPDVVDHAFLALSPAFSYPRRCRSEKGQLTATAPGDPSRSARRSRCAGAPRRIARP
jgi:hypothetical protein